MLRRDSTKEFESSANKELEHVKERGGSCGSWVTLKWLGGVMAEGRGENSAVQELTSNRKELELMV